MVNPNQRWPGRDYIPATVGHDAHKLMLLAVARRLSPALDLPLADEGTLVGADTSALHGTESPELSPRDAKRPRGRR